MIKVVLLSRGDRAEGRVEAGSTNTGLFLNGREGGKKRRGRRGEEGEEREEKRRGERRKRKKGNSSIKAVVEGKGTIAYVYVQSRQKKKRKHSQDEEQICSVQGEQPGHKCTGVV